MNWFFIGLIMGLIILFISFTQEAKKSGLKKTALKWNWPFTIAVLFSFSLLGYITVVIGIYFIYLSTEKNIEL